MYYQVLARSKLKGGSIWACLICFISTSLKTSNTITKEKSEILTSCTSLKTSNTIIKEKSEILTSCTCRYTQVLTHTTNVCYWFMQIGAALILRQLTHQPITHHTWYISSQAYLILSLCSNNVEEQIHITPVHCSTISAVEVWSQHHTLGLSWRTTSPQTSVVLSMKGKYCRNTEKKWMAHWAWIYVTTWHWLN